VVLIGFVKQIVGDDIELGQLLAANLDIGTSLKVQQSVAWCLSLGFIGTIDVILLEIALDASRHEKVVKSESTGRNIMMLMMTNSSM
jgi:hypothetical protein